MVYLTIICPNIAYVIHVVSYFVASPTTVHWVANIFGTLYFNFFLLPSTSTLKLHTFFNVDQSSDSKDYKSIPEFKNFSSIVNLFIETTCIIEL